MHIGSAMSSARPEGIPMVNIATSFIDAAAASVNLMCSPVPRAFPGLKFVWSEGGIGWISAAVEHADRQWERHKYWTLLGETLPSEIARRNMWFCMIEEPVGLKHRHDFTVDRILWECDYPHADTSWPNAQAMCKQLFDGVPQHEVDAITHSNAEALFDFPLSSALMEEWGTRLA
jgi:predicted TIM-barrel fold metal-dependent hydrolase